MLYLSNHCFPSSQSPESVNSPADCPIASTFPLIPSKPKSPELTASNPLPTSPSILHHLTRLTKLSPLHLSPCNPTPPRYQAARSVIPKTLSLSPTPSTNPIPSKRSTSRPLYNMELHRDTPLSTTSSASSPANTCIPTVPTKAGPR